MVIILLKKNKKKKLQLTALSFSAKRYDWQNHGNNQDSTISYILIKTV